MCELLTSEDLNVLLRAQVGLVEERLNRGLPVAEALANAARLARKLERERKKRQL